MSNVFTARGEVDTVCQERCLFLSVHTFCRFSHGLIAQLVEHCTGFAEVMGRNPVQA